MTFKLNAFIFLAYYQLVLMLMRDGLSTVPREKAVSSLNKIKPI